MISLRLGILALGYHLVGLAYAYGAAVIGIGNTLSLGMAAYGMQHWLGCEIDCVGSPWTGDPLVTAFQLLVAIALTFSMMVSGTAIILAMPPFLVVFAYVIAVVISRMRCRPAVVAMTGAILGPILGLPIHAFWRFLTSAPQYRATLLFEISDLSAGPCFLAAVGGASIGFVVARREWHGSIVAYQR